LRLNRYIGSYFCRARPKPEPDLTRHSLAGVDDESGQVVGAAHPRIRRVRGGPLSSEGPCRAQKHPEGLPMHERPKEDGMPLT
jgi:hypothetical protein